MIKNTFSEKVKREITQIEYGAVIQKSIFYGFILNNGSLNIDNENTTYTITITQPFLARYLKQLINSFFGDLKTQIIYKETHISHGYLIIIKNLEEFEKRFNIFVNPLELQLNEEEKKGFLIGAFLSSGSICFAINKSSYHFEIRSSNLAYLQLVQKILDEYQIHCSIIDYRNQHKLYFKKSEYLSDILKIMETEQSMFEFEDIRIQKDFTNSLQRLTNLEVSNINKTVIASRNHIKWITFLMENDLMDGFNDKTKKFCDIRLQYPEASLSTISDLMFKKYKIYIPRTSINHILKRIEKKYQEFN